MDTKWCIIAVTACIFLTVQAGKSSSDGTSSTNLTESPVDLINNDDESREGCGDSKVIENQHVLELTTAASTSAQSTASTDTSVHNDRAGTTVADNTTQSTVADNTTQSTTNDTSPIRIAVRNLSNNGTSVAPEGPVIPKSSKPLIIGVVVGTLVSFNKVESAGPGSDQSIVVSLSHWC